MKNYFGARYFDKEVEIQQRKEREDAERKRIADCKKKIEEELVDGSFIKGKAELYVLQKELKEKRKDYNRKKAKRQTQELLDEV